MYTGDFVVKDYMEEHAVKMADYIIETKATVRRLQRNLKSVSLWYI